MLNRVEYGDRTSLSAPTAPALPGGPVITSPIPRRPLSRRWLWLVGAVALAVTFAQSPGMVSPDTKLDLTANPLRFLARAANLWNSDLPFGQAQNQAYGYLFPHGAFFLAGDLLGLPGWVTQRLWWALLLGVGFWGLLRVAEALGIGNTSSRVIAATAFALAPRVLTTLGSISSETLPMMLAPWVLLPVILAMRGGNGRTPRILAAQAGVAMASMGAVNAVATLTGCLPALIWWACHRPNRQWLRFSGWWLLTAALAVTWWVIPLLLLGRVSPPFLDFIESSGVTTQWTSLTEVLRGTSAWTPFVAPNATAGASLVTGSVRHPGHHAGRRRWPVRTGTEEHARARATGEHAADRRRATGTRLRGGPGLPGGTPGAGIPGRRWCAVAQPAQGGAGRPDTDPAGIGASALPGAVARQRAAPGMDPGVRPPRGRQAGGRGDRGAGRAGRLHVPGVDGPAGPAGHLQRRSRSTGTRPPTG